MKHDLPRDTGSDYADESNNKPGLLPKTTQLEYAARAWGKREYPLFYQGPIATKPRIEIAFIAGYNAKSAEYVHEVARLQQVIEHQRQEIGKMQKHLAEDLPFMEFRKQPDPSPASGEFARAFSGASVADGAEMAAGADLRGKTGAGGTVEAGTVEVALKSPAPFIPYDSAGAFVDPVARAELLADAAEIDDPEYLAHAKKLAADAMARPDLLSRLLIDTIIAELDANPYGALAVAITTVVAAHATVPIFGDEA